MSYRIVIEPSHFGDDPEDVRGADEVIATGATDADVLRAAERWAWRLPLKVWTPSPADGRFLKLAAALRELDMDESHYSVVVRA